MPRLTPPPAAPLLLSVLFLAGCGTMPSPAADVSPPRVPASLLACAAQPDPPEAGADDRALAHWILDLAAAGADCRGRLGAVARILQQ